MSDPTSRALELLGLLQSRPVWSGPELAGLLGVTPRTVRRDVERLRGLGYTVRAEAGPEGGYELGRGQVLPPLMLDAAESLAVTLALVTAARDGNGIDAEAALRALGKIDAITPSATRARARELRRAVDVPAAQAGAEPALLLACAEAIRRGVRLRFDYVDRHGEPSRRDVEPYRLTARGRTWRLTAYDVDRGDWRSFRLDRLSEPLASTLRFSQRPGLEEALERAGRDAPLESWRHRIEAVVLAPFAVVRSLLPQAVGELRALGSGATLLVSGASDPAQAAWWLAELPFGYRVLGDAHVLEATRSLGERALRAAGCHTGAMHQQPAAKGNQIPQDQDALRVSAVLPVSPERAWDFVTVPGWFINDGELREHQVSTPEPGRHVVVDPVYGEFTFEDVEVLSPTRYASRCAHTGGDTEAPATLTVFELRPVEGGTEVSIVESGFASLGLDGVATRAAIDANVEAWVRELDLAARAVGA